MESVTLLSAYRAARAASYRDGRTGRKAPAPASLAIKLARDNLAQVHAARDAAEAARVESNESKAAAAFLAGAGGPAYQAADVAARIAARAYDNAMRRVTAAENLAGRYAVPVLGGGDYGAGTWQGDSPAGAAPSALPFNLPPAMRRAGSGGAARAMSRHVRAGADEPFGRGDSFYLHNPADGTLRNVRDAADVWRGASDWYDNPHGESFRDGTGLVCGVVAQLRGRNGRAVFVAGWRFKGHTDSGTFALGELFTAEGREESDADAAAEDAARAADELARIAAEAESEYQAAEAEKAAAEDAGVRWARAGETVAEARAAILRLLADRRKARAAGVPELPAICRAIKDSVAGFLSDIRTAREERGELAAADYGEHESAFLAGAGLAEMPA